MKSSPHLLQLECNNEDPPQLEKKKNLNLKKNKNNQVKVTQLCPTLCDPMDYTVHGQNTGVGSLSLLQGIFLTQGSNPGLPHCG